VVTSHERIGLKKLVLGSESTFSVLAARKTLTKEGDDLRNDENADIFAEMADMHELRGDAFYHKQAYRLRRRVFAAFRWRSLQLPREQLRNIHGIGPSLAGKLATLLDTGNLPSLEELRRNYPRSLSELRKIRLGPIGSGCSQRSSAFAIERIFAPRSNLAHLKN